MDRCRALALFPLLLVVAGCQHTTGALETCSPGERQAFSTKLSCVTRDLTSRQEPAPEAPPAIDPSTGLPAPSPPQGGAQRAPEPESPLAAADEVKPGGSVTLVAAVRRALVKSPVVGLAIATRRELAANVDAAYAPNLPRLQAQTATGHDVTGVFSRTSTLDYWDPSHARGAWRSDAGLTGSLMLYDFGATAADVNRAAKARDAQSLKTMAAIEDVTLNTAQAYLAVQQNRDVVRNARENLKALRDIAKLIGLSEQNGNGTKADLQRVNARVLDAEATLADQEYELKLSMQKLKRLIDVEPGQLPAIKVRPSLPVSPAAAVDEALTRSPAVLADNASIEAARAESESISAVAKPKLSVEGDSTAKNYYGVSKRTDFTYRGMLTLTYPIYDGGLLDARRKAAAAREKQAEMRSLATREELEAVVRKLYLQLASNRAKQQGLAQGVAVSVKARDLYRAQFSGGKRTLLELLDIQNSYYVAMNNRIANDYDQRRASFGILHAMGRLTESLL